MMINNRNIYGLTERDMKTIQDIFKRYSEITQVRLFGSRAKGNYKQGSDIDLAVMDTGVSSKVMSDIAFEFEESSLPYMVDLISYPTLKHEELIEHIDRVGIVFYETLEKYQVKDVIT